MKESLKLRLRKLNVNFKIFCLFINALLLFPFITNERYLLVYSGFLLIWSALLALLYLKLSSKGQVINLIKLWFIGLFFYGILALIFFFLDIQLSPSLHLSTKLNKIIYLTIYPIRVLAVFFMGMSFMEIISPIEFLRYGKIGFHISYLLRSFQVSMYQIDQNKKAMEMAGEIPRRYRSLSDYLLLIKKAPLILSLSIRNLMLWLFWSAHNFEKFKENYQIKKNKQ